MDTQIQNVNQDMMADLFPNMNQTDSFQKTSFGMQETSTDIFSPSFTEQTTLAPVEGTPPEGTPPEGTPPEGEEGKEGKEEGKREEADILGDTNTKPPVEIHGLSEYYQERVKNGKFIAIEEEDAEGNKLAFIPKTPEEYDEVLELQINYKLDEAKKKMAESWYESKSPAWKVVSQYAELVDDPSQLIPFLQGVKNLQSVSTLDENEIEGAEAIIRTRLSQRGDPDDLISQQIEALKTTDKLLSTAKQYKPLILQEEQTNLAAHIQREQVEQQKYLAIVNDIRNAAVQEIDQPIFGKTKLQQEEKAIIYDLIGEPNTETQGYGIYNAIDSLFESKDFKTLKEVALLLGKKESFYKYLGTNVANQTAAALEKKLRVAGESRQASGNDFNEEPRGNTIQRNQFKGKPTFGRT